MGFMDLLEDYVTWTPTWMRNESELDWARDRHVDFAERRSRTVMQQDFDKLKAKLPVFVKADEVLGNNSEPFHTMSHQDIWNNVQRMLPDDVAAGAAELDKIADDLENNALRFRRNLNGIFENQWSGAAAGRAREATSKYVNAESGLSAGIRMISNKLNVAQSGLRQVRAQMSPPGRRDWNDWVERKTWGIGDSDDLQFDARTIMAQVFWPVMKAADTGVPVAPPAQETLASAVAPPGMPAPVLGPQPSPLAPPGVPVAPKMPTSPTVPTMPSNVRPTQPDAHPLGSLPTNALPNVPGMPKTPANPGVPHPPDPHVPATAPAPVRPAAINPFDPAHNPAAHPLAAPLAPPQPSEAAKPSGPGGPSGPVGPGRAGMPGMPMMPMAGRGNSQDERERKTPKYLVNQQNGKDLIGRLPKVAPPVLGA